MKLRIARKVVLKVVNGGPGLRVAYREPTLGAAVVTLYRRPGRRPAWQMCLRLGGAR